jgi:hypothetical protein
MRKVGLVLGRMTLLGGVAVRDPHRGPVAVHNVPHYDSAPCRGRRVHHGLRRVEHPVVGDAALDAHPGVAVEQMPAGARRVFRDDGVRVVSELSRSPPSPTRIAKSNPFAKTYGQASCFCGAKDRKCSFRVIRPVRWRSGALSAVSLTARRRLEAGLRRGLASREPTSPEAPCSVQSPIEH